VQSEQRIRFRVSLADALRETVRPWRLAVCAAVASFLALGAATHSFRVYHLFTLLAIPAALFASDLGRRFFVEWGPLMATWIAYDRFRLVQPSLLPRVAVELPYRLERACFGWLAGGEAPAHAARAWLAAHAAESSFWWAVALYAQLVYVSHLFVYPALFFVWWWRGRRSEAHRVRFLRHAVGFAVLNALGFAGYLLFPAAPPWWVSLYGTAQPTPALVAAANLGLALDGELVRRTIATAPNWFAAVPSLHGAYPVLLFLLGLRERRRGWLAAVALYGAAMWAATVALNLHYVVDLAAGAAVAAVASAVVGRMESRGWLRRLGGVGRAPAVQ
jgi:hypothetical protein